MKHCICRVFFLAFLRGDRRTRECALHPASKRLESKRRTARSPTRAARVCSAPRARHTTTPHADADPPISRRWPLRSGLVRLDSGGPARSPAAIARAGGGGGGGGGRRAVRFLLSPPPALPAPRPPGSTPTNTVVPRRPAGSDGGHGLLAHLPRRPLARQPRRLGRHPPRGRLGRHLAHQRAGPPLEQQHARLCAAEPARLQ